MNFQRELYNIYIHTHIYMYTHTHTHTHIYTHTQEITNHVLYTWNLQGNLTDYTLIQLKNKNHQNTQKETEKNKENIFFLVLHKNLLYDIQNSMSIVLLQTHSLVLSWIACTDSIVIPRIYSKHEERCDSPVAPQAKAPDCSVNSTGSLTPVLHLERKAEFHVSTRDEAWLPCWNSIGTPRAMSGLERSPEVPASTQGGPMPCTNWRGISRSHL